MALTLFKAEPILKPDGSVTQFSVILADSTPDSLTITGADVEGMESTDVIAAGSMIIAPSKNYIAFSDGVFQEKT